MDKKRISAANMAEICENFDVFPEDFPVFIATMKALNKIGNGVELLSEIKKYKVQSTFYAVVENLLGYARAALVNMNNAPDDLDVEGICYGIVAVYTHRGASFLEEVYYDDFRSLGYEIQDSEPINFATAAVITKNFLKEAGYGE